jgi:hypothetical protein
VQQQDPPKTLKREITIQIVTESEEQQNQWISCISWSFDTGKKKAAADFNNPKAFMR